MHGSVNAFSGESKSQTPSIYEHKWQSNPQARQLYDNKFSNECIGILMKKKKIFQGIFILSDIKL